MERAWQRRHEWREIGAAAATKIRTLVPSHPAEVMAANLLSVASRTDAVPASAEASVVRL